MMIQSKSIQRLVDVIFSSGDLYNGLFLDEDEIILLKDKKGN